MSARPSASRFALFSLVALAVFAVLMSLGAWQVRRLAWKEDLLSTITTRVKSPPVPLADWLAKQPLEEYRPVTLAGTFRHESERHFFATHEGNSGYFVYTPLETAPGMFIFVNRGFVPFDRKDANTRKDGQVEGRVAIEGVARTVLAEKPSWAVPDNEPDKNIFYWKDIVSMRQSAGLPDGAVVVDAFVDAGAGATPPSGLPIGGVTLIDLPNNHLQYALTWYGLAGALVCVWSVMAWRQRKPPVS